MRKSFIHFPAGADAEEGKYSYDADQQITGT
jgi:hypothetical protein